MENNNAVGGTTPSEGLENVQNNKLVQDVTPLEVPLKEPQVPILNIQKPHFDLRVYKKYFLAALTICLVGVVFFILYGQQDKHVAVKQFTNVYSFVPEKLSKSAPIQIHVPEGVSEESARTGITFSPEVAGSWRTEELEGVVIFEPKKPLQSGVYYAVNMDTGSVQMSGDFYVDEDPQIEAIFPAADSESHEDSEITIVFNRPMVPLTTLSEQELVDLPISISPVTPGKFKWISTRNLQFVPETTLIPSSEYVVEIKSGLYSMDGLLIHPKEHRFTTRPLRYEFLSKEQVGYRSPIIIAFNQPVDLEQTKKQIKVEKDSKDISIDIQYGETTYYDTDLHKEVSEPDLSKIFVYQKKDAYGRSNLWDFETTYFVSIDGATPLAGNKDLREKQETSVFVPNIVQSVTAQSERTSLSRPDLFDPSGTLTVTFYDDINKDSSDIKSTGLKDIQYGTRCKRDSKGEEVLLGSGCEKEPDTKTLILSFDKNAFSAGQSFELSLNSVYTTDGFHVISKQTKIPLEVYPSFLILRTISDDDQSGGAALDGMYVCTNSPVKDPAEEGLGSYLKTDGYIVHGRWSNSEFVEIANSYNKCQVGEFETHLGYGLLPQTNYTINLFLKDSFDQTASQQLSFKTEAPKEQYTRFHNMQMQYNVTPSDRTKFTYAVENLESVDMHICKMSPENFLERTVNRVDQFTPPQSGGCTDVINKKIALPARYWVNNYFQVNLADYFADTRGQYEITFGNPIYKESYSNKQLYDRTYVSVSNLSVGKKEVEHYEDPWSVSTNPLKNKVLENKLANSSNLYWVNQSKTLTPVIGATITQYEGDSESTFVQRASGITNAQGIARAPIQERLVGAVIRSGSDTAVVTNWADMLGYAGEARDASRTYVYMDRPIYRPGHTVYMKGIDRIGFDGTYEIGATDQVKIEVFNSQGVSMYDTLLTQSQYGTFGTSFEIPANAPLGTYRIEVFGQSSTFEVEEYVPSAFKLEVGSNQEEYINGDALKLDVQADYYFGVPLSEGTVSYSVTAQDYYFDKYTDEYFNFGGGWYSCYSCGYGDDFLFRGETTLNENGKATIEKNFNLDDYFTDAESKGSKLVTVFITVKDINGRSVSSQKSFIVHQGTFYIGAKTDEYYTSVNTPITLLVKTVDTKGTPVSLGDVERTVFKVNWETFKRQEVDGGFYYKSEKKMEEISKEKIRTDKDGNWSGPLTFASEGEYEVHVSKKDDRNGLIETVSNVYIYGSESIAVPQNNNYELDIEVQKADLEIGDTASLLIKSPYSAAKALITVERGTIYDYWIVDIKGGLYLHEFPVKSEYAPNMYVSVLLLSPDPEVKYGTVEYQIGTKEHKLSVEVTANKTHYLPGEQVTLQVQTKDNVGRPVPAEVSLAVADLSVLALKGNPKKNPLLFFYDGFPLSVTTASNIKNILYEVDIPLGTKGGGGASPDDLATKKRGLFKDTAFWQGNVTTDLSGKATVSFTLPDNLTTWQIESLGVTKDTKLGVTYSEFTTKKDLMAVPLKPRFIVPGDTFSLGATVFNQTDKDTTVDVSLESSSLIFKGEKKDSVHIGKGESKTVYFEVEAPSNIKAGSHMFTFSASDGTFSDTVEQNIPITANATYETVATANFTKDDTATEYLYVPDEIISGEGGLTINANATMAVFMTSALSYMVTYPYGCSEQLASSLSTIGTLTSALKLPNVEGSFDKIEYDGVSYTVDTVVKDGLALIYETQNYSGGFAYYKGLNPDLSLTLHVITALSDLKAAGFQVDDSVLTRATAYVEYQAKSEYKRAPEANQETVILAEYVLRIANGGKSTSLTPIVQGLIDDASFLNEKISSMSLAYLSILTAENFSKNSKSRVYKALTNRIEIDGRGAYLSMTDASNSSYYETSIKDTALLLKAFASHKDEHPEMANALRWLLSSRDEKGVWGSTHNTFIVVDAMIDYLEWQHETESHFTLKGLLDGVEIFGFEVNSATIFETFTHFIPIDTLARQKLMPLTFERHNYTDKKSNFYYDIALKYFLPAQSLPPRDEGITITRGLFKLTDVKEEESIQTVAVGDVVRGKLTLTIPQEYKHVSIEDIIPAGFEIVNFNLDTEDQSLQDNNVESFGSNYSSESPDLVTNIFSTVGNIFGGSQTAQVFGSRGNGGSYQNKARKLYPTHVESHDDRVYVYAEDLNAGVYEYEYYLRALVPGKFQHLPARAEELFFPEIFGRTSGDIITVTPSK